jgi:haloacid dehalogenase superfamily, subfamily IA, variant 3 with third motif having DD or ED/haloacid dehalogenase superfamily, subfamily IA, variant 1 with third motif having Dx(3-4)D or Dx(3-4)E
MTTGEVTDYWFSIKPWTGIGLPKIEKQVIDRVGELIDLQGQIMPGVKKTLDYFKSARYKIGLATNSPNRLISIVLKKLNIEEYFDAILSAEFVDKGKPSPDIYIKIASILSVNPSRCVVFEDSFSGLTAAKAAGMFAVIVPESTQYHHAKFDFADLKISSLLDLHEDHIQYFNNLVQ